MTPPKSTTATAKQHMLESSILLMRHSGLSGAGINQVLAHSRAPKGSMYYYFPGGKLQLTEEALQLYGGRVAAYFDQALGSKNPPGAKVRALFAAVARRLEDGDFDQSCAVGAVTLDIEPEVAQLRVVVAGIMETWQSVIEKHLPMGSAASTRSFAGLLISAIEGGYIRGRADRSTRPLVDAGEWLARLAQEHAK